MKTSCCNRKLSCPYFVPSRSGFTTILWWIPILQKQFSFWLRACLKHACKVFMSKKGIYALILSKYCSAEISPFPYVIAAIKCAMLPSVLSWVPFAVKLKSKPSPVFFFYTIALGALVWSKGIILCVKTFWANFSLNFRSLLASTPFSEHGSILILLFW